ncbi:LysR family transcriptional regulator [Breoghania sp. JC706]|uniref:LysR family transcriptional regulator n=1 Tax=Breoghania sp. JC706 TaxID=3117732 RepID=UPI00300BB001
MTSTDLNLLRALDALLAEASVAGAARRLGLSASAMSRTLARLRETTGDPLLVRAGRSMVLTPHAAALRERVPHVAGEVDAILGRADISLDLATLERTFTIRANDAFVAAYAAGLHAAVRREAPGIRLRFAPKPDKNPQPLREAAIDLEIGVLGESVPELKVQTLFRDHYVGAVRTGHPLMEGVLTPERYAAADHVLSSRRSGHVGPIDAALAALGLERRCTLTVPSFFTALAIAAESDLVALVTHSLAPTGTAGPNPPALQFFELPFPTDPVVISQIWHPRLDNDPAHRWLRSLIRACCRPRDELEAGGRGS